MKKLLLIIGGIAIIGGFFWNTHKATQPIQTPIQSTQVDTESTQLGGTCMLLSLGGTSQCSTPHASMVQFINNLGTAFSSSQNFTWNNTTPLLTIAGSASISTNFEVSGYASLSNSLFAQNNGNVGIGNTTPNAKLDVSGTILASSSATSLINIVANNETDANFSLKVTGTSGFVARFGILGSGSTEFVSIASSGNVGIGTTSPGALLSVGAGATVPANTYLWITGGKTMRFGSSDSDGNYGTYLKPAFSTPNNGGTLTFGTRSVTVDTDVMTISGGNVGIGNTSPDQKLDVTGNILASTSGSVDLTLNNTAQAYGKFILRSMASPAAGRLDIIGGAAGATTLVSIASSGNVGIGTTSPLTQLHLMQSTNGVSQLRISNSADSNQLGMNFYMNGDDAGSVITFGSAVGTIGSAIPSTMTNTAGRLQFGIGTNQTAAIATSRFSIFSAPAGTAQTVTERLVVDGSGNVGIGNTSPDSKLDVTGNILASTSGNVDLTLNSTTENDAKFTLRTVASANTTARLDILGSASQAFVSIASSGNVGIGTTVPVTRFDVVNTASDGGIVRFQDSDGICTHNPESGGETVVCSSDSILKENIVDANSALDKLNVFQIKAYDVKENREHKDFGVIAQEVQQINPDLVSKLDYIKTTETIDSKTGSISYIYDKKSVLGVQQPNLWELVKAIQELNAKNQALETRVAALEKVVGTPPLGSITQQPITHKFFYNLIHWFINLLNK